MLTSMARRPPTHVHNMNGLHHQPYHSKPDDDDDDNEEERDARRARSRILANKLSESLLHRSSSSSSTTNKEDSIEQRIKTAIDICDIDTLRQIYCQSSCPISIERRFKSGGWTALIHAAYSCHFSLVSLFILELGADVNSKSSEQMTPLMACCMSSHSKSSTTNGNDEQLSICRFLLEHGAEIEPATDITDEKLMTPLMLAARFGCSAPLIHLLVEYGAKIDRCDAKGWCPLIMATQHGHLGSVEALLRSGADLKSTTNNGLTALEFAQHLKHETIVQFLLDEQKQSVSLNSSQFKNKILFLDIIIISFFSTI
jgi:ankyrin repeat protein